MFEFSSFPLTIYQLLPILATILIWYIVSKYRYWSSRGIPGPIPIPLLGNLHSRMFVSPVYLQIKWKKQFGSSGPFYGLYSNFQPILVVQDPELIKQFLVKDFHLFVNRRVQPVYHPIWNNNLFVLEDDRWKTVRSITSPTFTSGKLRGMHQIMNRCVQKLIKYLDRLSSVISQPQSFNVNEVIGGFTLDVIASTSFATETDTNDDRSRKSPFLTNAFRFFKPNVLKILFMTVMPRFILELCNCRVIFDQNSFDYFVKLSKKILQQRAGIVQNRNLVKRHDLVQLLLDASVNETELHDKNYSRLAANIDQELKETNVQHKKGRPLLSNDSVERKLTEKEIVAQCILFILAGYETTTSTLTFLLYELAVNQDTQQRLYDELNKSLSLSEKSDSNSDQYYETVINNIPYLEAVIKETLRKYPPVSRLERRVSVSGYKLGSVELFKEQVVEIPVYALHHTEEFFPEPERFNPDRFMPENNDRLVPYSYLPFGQGPRNCLGMRFAYQEMKLVVAQLFTRYRFETNQETPIPLQFKKGTSMLNVAPFSINVTRRRHNSKEI